MNIENIKSVYFVGAGGIGMSALIRYFLSKGKLVAGYDRTPSELTEHLIAEGAQIHYEEKCKPDPRRLQGQGNNFSRIHPGRSARSCRVSILPAITVSKYKNAPRFWEQSPTAVKVCA